MPKGMRLFLLRQNRRIVKGDFRSGVEDQLELSL
jgi:hypothetical protein